jgi:hypothetical protein
MHESYLTRHMSFDLQVEIFYHMEYLKFVVQNWIHLMYVN